GEPGTTICAGVLPGGAGVGGRRVQPQAIPLCCSALAELPSALRSSAQRGELQQANLNKKGQPFCGWPKVLLGLLHLEKLEGEVSVESHGTVGPGVSPGFAECTWCNSSSIHTVYVAIVDVESRYAQELVVESIEDV